MKSFNHSYEGVDRVKLKMVANKMVIAIAYHLVCQTGLVRAFLWKVHRGW
jgi:hypothetical protein